MMAARRGRGRSKKKKNHYFTKDHEKAIIRYCKSEDIKEKNLIEKIVIGILH